MPRLKALRYEYRYKKVLVRQSDTRISSRLVARAQHRKGAAIAAFNAAFESPAPYHSFNDTDLAMTEELPQAFDDNNNLSDEEGYTSDDSILRYLEPHSSSAKEKHSRINLENRESNDRLWEQINILLGKTMFSEVPSICSNRECRKLETIVLFISFHGSFIKYYKYEYIIILF